MGENFELPGDISEPDHDAYQCSIIEMEETLYLDDDPQNDPTFVEEQNLDDPLLEAQFDINRDWEPQETENGVTVNTTPDPTMFVFEGAQAEYVVAFAATPLNIVYAAMGVMGDLNEALRSLVHDVERDNNGIESVTVKHVADDFADAATELEVEVESVVAAAESDESYSAFDPNEAEPVA